MGKKEVLMVVNDHADHTQVYIKKPITKYLDRYITSKASVDIQKLELFPNAKEVTESYAAIQQAVRLAPPGDPNVCFVSIGDGATPRTAGAAAFHSRWTCVSIDPNANHKTRWENIDRLTILRQKIEEVVDLTLPSQITTMIIACVHSHAPWDEVKNFILRHPTMEAIHLIAIPCCVPIPHDWPQPNIDKYDWGIWSPERQVLVWKDINIIFGAPKE